MQDVDYCIEMALDWKSEDENNTVFVNDEAVESMGDYRALVGKE